MFYVYAYVYAHLHNILYMDGKDIARILVIS